MNSQPATSLLLFLVWTMLIAMCCPQIVPANTCDEGWFGSNCQYKCRCGRGETCGQDGECSNDVCSEGWFGPACQFVDLAFPNSKKTTDTWMYDRDVTTCNHDQSLKPLKVKMSSPFPFTWLRLQVNDSSLLHEFQVKFKEKKNQRGLKCRNKRNAIVDEITLDIHCDLDVPVKTVVLKGDGIKSLCSLYVSGGRNVALRQNTSQSSTYSNQDYDLNYSRAKNAVDGNTNGVLSHKSCSSTNVGDTNPSWTVTLFPEQVINRYVVYSASRNADLFKRFSIRSFTKDLKMVFNYTDSENDTLYSYTITPVHQTAKVSMIEVSANNKMSYPVLSLCEVELYGDSACPPSRYGRECEHTCNCAVKDESCFVSTGGCPSGCAAGFQGEACDRVCDFGKYGLDCRSNCSQFCVTTNSSSSPCRHMDGACVLGCVSGYQTLKCERVLMVEKMIDFIPETAVIGPSAAVVVLVVMTVVLWRRYKPISHNKSPTVDINEERKDFNPNERVKHNELERNNSYKRRENVQSPTVSQVIVPKQTTNNIMIKSNSIENVYCNFSPDLNLTSMTFRDLTRFMNSHDKAFFKQQFNSIPVNINATTRDGMNEENKHKNRYKNICAFDHSRVLLKTSSEKKWGDYINASYIEGYRGQRKFIASQGPTKATLEDFVRMLSEQGVQVVVMLTNLTEDGKVKCERYWPEDDEIQAGDIKVKLTTTQVFANYTIRRLQLLRDGDCVHELTQFHFTAWPDKDVPTTAWSLVDFEQRVASISTDKPIVVHCSAGVGRTGTFIALCNVLVEATETGYMDFFTAVQKLRHDRAYMVQTSDQYEFLHRAALVAVEGLGTTVVSMNTDSEESLMEQEFQVTRSISFDDRGNVDDKAPYGICYKGNDNLDGRTTRDVCGDDS